MSRYGSWKPTSNYQLRKGTLQRQYRRLPNNSDPVADGEFRARSAPFGRVQVMWRDVPEAVEEQPHEY